ATDLVETTAAASTTTDDQVDNNTHSSLGLIKSSFVNRMNDKYHREDERLRTYDNNWPLDWLDKRELAMTGMFYTNQDDKVKCYFCEVEIGRWERTDQPVPEHLRWSPNCPLLRRRTTNNLPINADALERLLPPASYDICGSNDSNGLEIREHAYSEGRHVAQPLAISFSPAAQVHSLPARGLGGDRAVTVGVGSTPELPCHRTGAAGAAGSAGGNYFPEYPEYAIETARLRSFEDWPRTMKQRPEQLAEAGFFYTGVGDRVRCFSCGGGLKDWDNNDEPWEQHALWLSHCRFVKLIKGQLYIDAVREAAAEDAKCGTGLASLASSSSSGYCSSTNSIASSTNSCASTDTILCRPAASSAAVATQPEAAAEGDVAPTAASRIYQRIVAHGCTESGAAKVASNSVSNAPAAAACIPEEKLCKICYSAEYNTAFLPCGHVVACAKCASSVTKCPLCRKPFTDVMRVYFS
ncbi:hypothetical protein KR222_008192, partial [Zaprionus bogoriensis]